MESANPIKVVFCGGPTTGKSCLLATIKTKEFTDSYLLPREVVDEPFEIDIEGKQVKVLLNDLGKVDDY
jgi:GTPase SAR1 family protein